MKKGLTETRCLQIRLQGNETSLGGGLTQGTGNVMRSGEFKAGESQIYSEAPSVNNELNLSFLPTAKKKIIYNNNSNESFICRALLDSGSECCLSQKSCKYFRIKRKSSKISLRGSRSGVTAGQTKGCVDLVIRSQSSNERLEVNAFILKIKSLHKFLQVLDMKDLDYLKSIPLSD
ncbi:DUF1758 domain-containing protein [Trichonephila clavipes]|nr:DUF1758 domain-containing protein [Trichonephila clavipes]